MTIDLGAFDALTFDCYGTLIDWERGIPAGMRPVLGAAGAEQTDDELLERYARHEAELEAAPTSLPRGARASRRGVADELGVEPAEDLARVRRFGRRVAGVPRLAGGAGAAAHALPAGRDDQLRRRPLRPLGAAAGHDVRLGHHRPAGPWVQAARENFTSRFGRLGLPRERVLHVAQSLFHDHVPAQRLGLTTVWIDRRGGRAGGATPPAEAAPDATFPDMASFAAAAVS